MIIYRHKFHPDTSTPWVCLALITLNLCMSTFGDAISTLTNCSCSPLVYKMRLNFSLTCPPYNVSTGPDTGIERLLCQISASSNSDDLVPVSVVTYRIIELGQSLSPIRVKSVENTTLLNGDTIILESSTLSNVTVISGGLQIGMTGVNVNNEVLKLDIILQYTNRCGILPFNFGSSLGWLVFEGDMEPMLTSCFPSTTSPKSIRPSSVPSATASPLYYPLSANPSSINHIPFKRKKAAKSKGKETKYKKAKWKSSYKPSTQSPSHQLSMMIWNIFQRSDVISGIHVKNVTM